MHSRVCIIVQIATVLLVASPASTGMWTDWEWLNPQPQGRSLGGLASSDSRVVQMPTPHLTL